MLTPEITADIPQLPALIYTDMCVQFGIDPAEAVEEIEFCGLGLEYPPPTLHTAMELITGQPYGLWQHSDAAKLLAFLNEQPTSQWPIIEGDLVIPGTYAELSQLEDGDNDSEGTSEVQPGNGATEREHETPVDAH